MDSIQILQIERDIIRLVLDAAHYADTRAFQQLADLFTPEGMLFRPTASAPLVGREAIVESYNARPDYRRTRHLCTNFRVDVESPESVRVRCYAQVFGADKRTDAENNLGPKVDGNIMVGEFDDRCVLENGRWLISERRASFAMHLPL